MRTNRGVVAETILVYVIVGMLALFVPNPVSSAFGVGIRPNKTIKVDKTELIYDKEGVPIAYRHISSDEDIQQKVTFWEWLRSLPMLALILMVLGAIFPPIALVLVRLWRSWRGAFKNTYDGLRSLRDTTVICRKCGDSVTIDTKEWVFNGVELKQDKRDKILQEKVRTELVK